MLPLFHVVDETGKIPDTLVGPFAPEKDKMPRWRPKSGEYVPLSWSFSWSVGVLATLFRACLYLPQIWFNWRHSTRGGLGVYYVAMQGTALTISAIAGEWYDVVELTVWQEAGQATLAWVLLLQILYYDFIYEDSTSVRRGGATARAVSSSSNKAARGSSKETL